MTTPNTENWLLETPSNTYLYGNRRVEYLVTYTTTPSPYCPVRKINVIAFLRKTSGLQRGTVQAGGHTKADFVGASSSV